MPLYEYLCRDCEAKFELRRSFSQADAPVKCTHCHSDNTKKLISSFISFSKGGNNPTPSSGCAGCSGGSCATCRI